MSIKKFPPYYLPIISAFCLALARMDIGCGFLCLFGLIPLFYWLDLDKVNLWRGALLFSIFFNGIYIYWIAYVTFWGYIGIVLFFVLYFLIVFYFVRKCWQYFPKFKFLSFAAFWITLEFYMNYTEIAFPWMSLGYSLSDYLYLIQLVSLGGMSILSLLIIAVNYSIFVYFKTKDKRSLLCSVLILATWMILGVYLLNSVKLHKAGKKIAILQPNISLEVKHSADATPRMLTVYNEEFNLLEDKEIDLLLLPESAIMDFPLHNKNLYKKISDLSKKVNANLFLGFLDYQLTPARVKYFNSCSQVDSTDIFYPKYSKTVLVPLGERIPYLDIFPFLWSLNLGQANWEYGEGAKFYSLDDYSFSPVICYEIAFPKVLKKLAKADFVVNLTNDAWFRKSVGATQHMQMAVFRAIEIRKAIYRCANTGYSVVVLPTGRILEKLPLFEDGVIISDLYVSDSSSLYSRLDYEWIFVGLSLIFAVAVLYKRKNNNNGNSKEIIK